MARRLFVAMAFASCVLAPGVAQEALAQERAESAALDLTPVFRPNGFPIAAAQPIRLVESEQRPSPLTRVRRDHSRTLLGSLYASTALMQKMTPAT